MFCVLLFVYKEAAMFTKVVARKYIDATHKRLDELIKERLEKSVKIKKRSKLTWRRRATEPRSS